MEINDRLKSIREYLGESQQSFSQKLGMAQSTYSKYEKNALNIPDTLKEKLFQYGIDLNWLITGVGSMIFDSAQNRRNQNGCLSEQQPPYSRQTDSVQIEQNRKRENSMLPTGSNESRLDEAIDKIDFLMDVMKARGMMEEDGKTPLRVSCPVCHVANRLSEERQIKVVGYAEALFREQEVEESAKKNQNAG